MNNNISTELYRAFYRVGLNLSFSKAAKAVGVSQSAISQSVKQLEKDLGLKLFIRTTKSVDFTPEGKELFDTVAKAFSILDDGVGQLMNRVEHEMTGLKLSASDTLCRHYLLPFLKIWQEKFPQIGLQIYNRPSPKCVESVRKNKSHVAIVNIYDELLSDCQMETTELMTLHDVFVGGAKYKKRRKYTIEEIMQESMLLLETGSASRIFFDDLLQGYHKVPDFELGSLDVLIDLLRINMGVSLVPREFIEKDLAEGSLVELKTDFEVPARKIGLVRSRLQPLPESASEFLNLIMENKKK